MFSIKEIKKLTKGTLLQGDDAIVVKGISINSKTVKAGDLFVAIKGKRFDGHRFIKEAVRNGAAAVVMTKLPARLDKNIPIVEVKNTIKALGDIARAHRDKFSVPVIAITGSAGKTTTKEMIAAVLGSKFKILKNEGTENNHIGVPLTLFKLNASHKAVVVELGTNCFGDIRWLTQITNPTIAVLTNIGESHLEKLKSLAYVFKEKFNLVKGMAGRQIKLPIFNENAVRPLRSRSQLNREFDLTAGTVIFNSDDKYLRKIPGFKLKRKLISYGIDNDADYNAVNVNLNKDCSLQFKIKRAQVVLNTPVMENIYNALAAIICGRIFNISYNNINKSIKRLKFSSNRQSIKKVNGFRIIDDTYNSNPVSFRSALKTISFFKTKGRKILVCGDMLELGKRARELHIEMGKLAAGTELDVIFTHGKLSEYLANAVRLNNSNIPVFHYNTLAGLNKKLLKTCQPGDVILVKGSRGTRMERVVEFLQNRKV